MVNHVSHNNDRKYYRIAIDTAKEGDEIFNLTEYFKGRVGDRNYGLQMTWYEQGSLKNVKGLKPYIRGNVGHYSIGDNGEIIMAPDAAVVSYVGDPSDTDVAGRVVYRFPEQMFTQEGIFYGFLGLLDDSDGDQRLSGVNVWFKVLGGVAYMGKASAYYIDEMDKLIHNSEERIRQLMDQGQKDVDAKQAALQAIVDDYKAKMSDLIERLNAQGQTANSMMETVKAGLSALETKIKQDGLFTKGEAESFKDGILADVSKKVNVDGYKSVANSVVDDYNVPGVVNELNDFANGIDKSKFNALLLTDMHWTRKIDDSDAGYANGGPLVIDQLKNMSIFDSLVDAVVLNGDNIHGNEGGVVRKIPANVKRTRELAGVSKALFLSSDLWVTMGNHDNGTVWWQMYYTTIKQPDLQKYYGVDKPRFGETRDGFFGYKDYDGKKVRVIVLDAFENPDVDANPDANGGYGQIKWPTGSYSIFTDRQIQGLVKALKTVPDDYHVLVFSHCPLEGYFANAPYDYITNINHDVVRELLQAFANHSTITMDGKNPDFPTSVTADFRQTTGVMVGIVCGHEHLDKDVEVHDGLPSYERTCFIPCYTNRVLGKIVQYAFDVIEVDHDNRKITFKRFGWGSDLSYGY